MDSGGPSTTAHGLSRNSVINTKTVVIVCVLHVYSLLPALKITPHLFLSPYLEQHFTRLQSRDCFVKNESYLWRAETCPRFGFPCTELPDSPARSRPCCSPSSHAAGLALQPSAHRKVAQKTGEVSGKVESTSSRVIIESPCINGNPVI